MKDSGVEGRYARMLPAPMTDFETSSVMRKGMTMGDNGFEDGDARRFPASMTYLETSPAMRKG